MSRGALRELLERHSWNVHSAARAVGWPDQRVMRLMARLGLRREYDRRRMFGPKCGQR